MRNEKLGTDTVAAQYDFDSAAGYADIEVSVGATVVTGGVRIYANGTVAFPSHTTTTRDALTNLAAGQCVYNTTTNKLNFYNGSAWEAVTSS